MFSVYKYYENPGMLVKSKYHKAGTDEKDFVEVRELVPKIKFFDAPMKPAVIPPPAANESDASKLPPPPVAVEWIR